MKKTFTVAVIVCLVALTACQDNDSVTFALGIDIQSSFNQDKVQVFIDEQEVINEILTTNELLGVCSLSGATGLVTHRKEGSHTIKVVINDTFSKIENFTIDRERYVGVNFSSQTNEISIVYANQRFLYD